MEAMNKNKGKGKEGPYCLCHLPDDLLRIILSYLSVLDYINFRAVCKCWRLAFSKSAAAAVLSQEKPGREPPWFLILMKEPPTDKSFLADIHRRNQHAGTMRDKNPVVQIWVAAALQVRRDRFFRTLLLQSLVQGKDSTPVFGCINISGHNGPALNVVFAKGIFYCLHMHGELIAYDPSRGCYIDLDIQDYIPGYSGMISYPVKRGEQIFPRVHGKRCFEVPLMYSIEPLVAKEIGCQHDGKLNYQECEYLFRTDVEEAIVQEKGVVSVDSFNVDAWCAVLGADDDVELRWHWFSSNRTKLYPLDDICGNFDNDCSTFVMWVEPVWVHPSPNLTWN
ncbi:hypothetical protein SCA6_018733 [Theobroma cacao]